MQRLKTLVFRGNSDYLTVYLSPLRIPAKSVLLQTLYYVSVKCDERVNSFPTPATDAICKTIAIFSLVIQGIGKC